VVKGIAILWIVFFHGFKEFGALHYPWPLHDGYWLKMCGASAGALEVGVCALQAAVVAVSSVGFHGVSVFILLSGFTLSLSVARRADDIAWWPWYRSRLTRLFPLYWTAHVIYLVSPSAVHLEAIDYRLLLSFLGDRLVPLEAVFLYANAAWWYFGLLLQIYLVFPVLFRAHRRLGSARFLLVAAVITVTTRYLLLFPLASQHSESLLLGALFTSRLFELAAGIALADAFTRDSAATLLELRRPSTLALGAGLYAAGVYSYSSPLAYVATDALIGCGLTILLVNLAGWIEPHPRIGTPLLRVGQYSYGLYLLHQPYMTWLGTRLSSLPLAAFIAVGLAATAVLALASMAIEKRVNRLTTRWLG